MTVRFFRTSSAGAVRQPSDRETSAQRAVRCASVVVMATDQVSPAELLANLGRAARDLQAAIDEHLDEYDEVLLTVLVADVRRWVISEFYNMDDDATVTSVLTILDDALLHGDQDVSNAVAVAFVEDSCAWDPRMDAFLSRWPAGLQAEAERQHKAH